MERRQHGCLGRTADLTGSSIAITFLEPFIRGWLTKFALSDPSAMNEEMVRALTTCAQQPGAEHAIFGFRGQLAFDIESRLDRVPHPVSVLA